MFKERKMDIALNNKNKSDILLSSKRLKEIGGGIVLVNQGEIIYDLKIELNGTMFIGGMQALIQKERELNTILADYGYKYENPVFNLLFLSATHLPYIRI